jgi:hypothetical protein
MARADDRRHAYRVLVRKPEGKRLLGKYSCSWEVHIKIDLPEIGWGFWIELIWLRTGTGGEFFCAPK